MPPIRPSLICERIEAQLVAQRLQRAAQKSTGLDSPVLNFEILWEIRQARSLLGRLMLGVLVRLEFPAFNVACVPMQGSAMTYAMKHLHVFQFQTIPWFGAVSSHVLLYARPQKGQCVRPAQKDLCTNRLFL